MFIFLKKCVLECESGKFGMNCNENCGHCSNASCNHVNGTCVSGCTPGYHGSFCQKGKLWKTYKNAWITKQNIHSIMYFFMTLMAFESDIIYF